MHEAAYSSSSIFTPLHFTLSPSAMHAADAVQNTLSKLLLMSCVGKSACQASLCTDTGHFTASCRPNVISDLPFAHSSFTYCPSVPTQLCRTAASVHTFNTLNTQLRFLHVLVTSIVQTTCHCILAANELSAKFCDHMFTLCLRHLSAVGHDSGFMVVFVRCSRREIRHCQPKHVIKWPAAQSSSCTATL